MKTVSAIGSLPTMTTVDHLYSRSRARWMTAVEKLSNLSFPATAGIAKVYGVEACHQVLQLT